LKANPSAGDLITLLKPVTVQYRPYWSDPARHSVSTITLPAGTKVEFMSRDGDNVRFYLADADYGIYGDYEIPVDATDIKN